MKLNKTNIAIIVVVLFHLVGIAGFFIPSAQALFIKIVPFHLLLMLGVVVYSHNKLDSRFLQFIALIFTAGFAIEWLGVHMHLIFGDYLYGATLGFKFNYVPLIIGVNWVLLIYSTGVLMQYLPFQNGNLKVMVGALVLVLLDFLIEPVAVRFDYWHWLSINTTLTAPLENYLGWFLVSGLMLGIFQAFKFNKQSMVALVLLAAQFVFFTAMHWVV
jgi:putative membrane protein